MCCKRYCVNHATAECSTKSPVCGEDGLAAPCSPGRGPGDGARERGRGHRRPTLALSSRNSGWSGVVCARHCSTSGRNRNCGGGSVSLRPRGEAPASRSLALATGRYLSRLVAVFQVSQLPPRGLCDSLPSNQVPNDHGGWSNL